MGFAPFDRAARSEENRSKDRPLQNPTAKRKNASAIQFSLETRRVAAMQEKNDALCNGFVSGAGHLEVAFAMPRNKSRQFRPAGTRVALPSTNCRSSKSESGLLQDFFSQESASIDPQTLSPAFLREVRLAKNFLCCLNCTDASS
jgi:hypothetical protein